MRLPLTMALEETAKLKPAVQVDDLRDAQGPVGPAWAGMWRWVYQVHLAFGMA